MKLQYDKKEMVRILDSDNFTVATFNNVVQRFIQNDLKFFTKTENIPGTWENRWYNSPEDTSLRYMAGDAVWINCYNEDEFISGKWNDIEEYVSQNGNLQAEYLALKQEGDTSKISEFFKKVVGGHGGNPPLYYLGDINKPIQIRISLVDDNPYPPSDEYTESEDRKTDVYWTDFFKSQTKTEIIKGIFDFFYGSVSNRKKQHEDTYHMTGLFEPESFMENHMHVDLQNAVYKQKMKSHYWFQEKLNTGFDSVYKFSERKLESGGVQWFRLWKSGYLEHGGMIGLQDANDPTSGIQLFDERFIRIDFGWMYDNGNSKAPAYDYPTDLLNRVYAGSTNINIGKSSSGTTDDVETHFQVPKMGSTYKYSVYLNSVLTDQETEFDDMPNPFMVQGDPLGLKYYSAKEIFDQTNEGFSFFINSQPSRYSYYASGFTTKGI